MAPLLLSCLVGSLTRQMSQVARCAASCSLPAVGAQRCFSTITVATMQFRRFFNPMCKPHTAFLSPLLGQCQQLLCVQPSAGMKTKTALKRRCKDCFSFAAVEGCLFFASPTPDTSSGRGELMKTSLCVFMPLAVSQMKT